MPAFLIVVLFMVSAADSHAETQRWIPAVWEEYIRSGPVGENLPDFSSAGYRGSETPPPRPAVAASVRDFGAIPDDGLDDGVAIQAAIDAVEGQGGGVVFLPAGTYDLNTELFSGAPGTKHTTAHGLVIRKSGVVLRGERTSVGATVLRQHHVPHRGGGALVRFAGSGSQGSAEASIVADARRGDFDLGVDDTVKFSPGEVVKLILDDPGVDPDNPKAGQADLTRAMVEPFVLRDDLKDYLARGTRGRCFLLLEIASVPCAGRVRLKLPLRLDVFTRWSPRLTSFATINDVGIEDIRFESRWPGGFAHHKPYPIDAGGDYVKGGPGVIRTANEQNYAWCALSFTHVAHAWARNLTFANYTQDITIASSRAITIDAVSIIGQKGHTGITLNRSHDCLVRDVTITAPRVHTFFVSAYSSGNVFTKARFEYGPHDKQSDCDTCLDFHGLAPFENLYDGIVNAYVYPGGAYGYLPHAGHRNVFWNILAPARMLRGGDSAEFFRTYAPTSSGKPQSAHEHWPKSFVIGVHRDGPNITIGGNADDRSDAWLVVEGLNRPGVQPASLYQSQVERKRAAGSGAGK